MPTHHAHFSLLLQLAGPGTATTAFAQRRKGAKKQTTTTGLTQRRKGAKLQPQ
jgi:hypothetical protein